MVITDFYLEGKLTGGDLLHAIRTRLHLSQQELPVLVLTGSDDKQKQVEVFHAGGNDFVGKPIIEEVLIARVRSLLLIKHQYDALKKQTETMRWIAATDSLTGVRSKRYLVDNGESYIRDSTHQPVWAILLDIDHFKQINDRLGHITGDHVLAEIGETLNQWFPDEMVVRFGGEEFCVLIKRHEADAVMELAEKLRQHVQQQQPAGVDVTISLGLAGTEDHPGQHLSEFLNKADQALYHSKEQGRNRASIFTAEGIQESPWNHSSQ
jgi:two-component system cell cycle response regulator